MENLKSGSSGDEVILLQKRLKEFGFYDGEPDGKFNEKTEKAVKDFQEFAGLADDGLVGLMTQQALDLLEFEPSGEDSQEGDTENA